MRLAPLRYKVFYWIAMALSAGKYIDTAIESCPDVPADQQGQGVCFVFVMFGRGGGGRVFWVERCFFFVGRLLGFC